jgi:DNA-binding Xre family transcriptional regulator
MVGMHVVSIAYIETGKRNVTVDNLRKICRALKIKLSAFDDLI